MKTLIFAALLYALQIGNAYAGEISGSEIPMTPKQSCLLMQQTLMSVPIWRDNGVPIEQAQKNVRDSAEKTVGFDENEKARWVAIAGNSYKTHFTQAQVLSFFNKNCNAIALVDGDPGYTPKAPPTPPTAEEIKSNERARVCIFKANAYGSAALFRNAQHSPEEALRNMRINFPDLDEKFLKTAINNVYFNRDFAYAGGQPLVEQMLDLCINGSKNWKPLK